MLVLKDRLREYLDQLLLSNGSSPSDTVCYCHVFHFSLLRDSSHVFSDLPSGPLLSTSKYLRCFTQSSLFFISTLSKLYNLSGTIPPLMLSIPSLLLNATSHVIFPFCHIQYALIILLITSDHKVS